MENNTTQPQDTIDLVKASKTLWNHKMTFLKVWIVTFVVSCIWILPQPRSYISEVKLAPEAGTTSVGGTLAGIASSFGFDIGANNGNDALYPELYPELMSTNMFAVNMLYVDVENEDGEKSTYLEYLRKHNRQNPYLIPFTWTSNKISQLFEKESKGANNKKKRLDPRRLSKQEQKMVDIVLDCINCDVDVKTSVITITTSAQDPLVATALADSACQRLQAHITEYRTSKARIDVDYYKLLCDSAYKDYQKSVADYIDFCDHHVDVALQQYISARDNLENEMQSNLNIYNTVLAQYNVAKAKVQENTPAFTVLQAASVPIKPSTPKRMIFVIIMLFLATIGEGMYLLRNEIFA